MKFRVNPIALTAILLASLPGIAAAYSDCPANHTIDGYDCQELKVAGDSGGFFRVTFPSDWDGDLVVINHGFDLNGLHIRPHETCGYDQNATCESDADCTAAVGDQAYKNFCNNISYLGLDEVLLPKGKAVAASTYHQSGWAVFGSAKDIKDMITYVKKNAFDLTGKELQRVIVTGFSLGGAVTGDATLKLKIDGAVPLCAAVGGGLPTWDVAQDVRLVYDFLCDNAPAVDPIPVTPKFADAPDVGLDNGSNSGADAQSMAIKANNCLGMLFPSSDVDIAAAQAQRLSDFLELTRFSGYQGDDAGTNVASAIGFATLGLGDFVKDPDRLDGKRIGRNDTLDYTTIGDNPTLAAAFNAPRVCSGDNTILCTNDNDCTVKSVDKGPCIGGVKRMTKGPGRGKLKKASWPDFTKGKGSKVAYPILMMAGANDWLVIPEFERVYTSALANGNKAFTQTWIDTFGHCVFTEEEVTATFNKYFEWIGEHPGDTAGSPPSKLDVHDECLTLGAAEDCNFNDSFAPGALKDRIPARPDWPVAATQ